MSYFRFSAEVLDAVRKKIKIFVFLVVLAFLCLWMRVWYLQILSGQYFQELSENNRVRLISLPANRGTILDRNRETLVSIRPSFNLYITPEDARDPESTLALLSTEIQFDHERVKKEMSEARSFKNVLIKGDIERGKVAFVEENKMRLPGVQIKVEPLRSYVHKDMSAHVLGYLGEISKATYEELDDASYQLGDLVGKNGLENIYESILRGKKGQMEVEVDVSGRVLKTLRKLPAQSGNNLILTLDVRVQQVLEKLMTGTSEKPVNGSVVVMKVQTGEIIAIASKPSFDANLFAAGISRDDWNKLIHDKRHPLQNRVIDGQYPPGSTFKIVVALAGLEEKIVTPETTVFCPGHYRLGKGSYRCWKRGGHGTMNLENALIQSCDVFFYTIGRRLGIDTIARYATQLGLGNYTGIRLLGEKRGLVPTKSWKLLTKNEPWLAGETISASIGQGFNLVTPIQQVNMISTISNGGMLLNPYLVRRIEDPDGNILKEFFPRIVSKVKGRPGNLEIIRKALLGVVNGPRGTGRRARLKDIRVSGKTGTSQVVRLKAFVGVKEKDIPYEFRDHAWFVSFAPYENPEIAVAVIIDHGGHGGSAAAPIAKELFQAYFKYYPVSKKKETNLSLTSG